MVKSITSAGNIVKTAALGALLAGSVALGGATNPIKVSRQDNPPNQTEVISKEGAEAVKTLTLPQQPKPAVPTVRNKKIDDKFLKFMDTDIEKKELDEALSDIYKQNGSYLGSVLVQQNLDLNAFLAFLNGDIEILKNFDGTYDDIDNIYDGFSYYDVAKKYYDNETKAKVADLNNKIGKWINENYFNIYSEPFTFDHLPDYVELKKNMDKFEEHNDLEFTTGRKMFDDTDSKTIYNRNNIIRSRISKTNSDSMQKDMDFFAERMQLMDYELFSNIMNLYYDYTSSETLYDCFDVFMQAVEPKIE